VSGPAEETEEQILAELTHRAITLWGSERAEALAPSLANTAGALRQIAEHPPEREQEPAIFG
jgi:hypothetical protein